MTDRMPTRVQGKKKVRIFCCIVSELKMFACSKCFVDGDKRLDHTEYARGDRPNVYFYINLFNPQNKHQGNSLSFGQDKRTWSETLLPKITGHPAMLLRKYICLSVVCFSQRLYFQSSPLASNLTFNILAVTLIKRWKECPISGMFSTLFYLHNSHKLRLMFQAFWRFLMLRLYGWQVGTSEEVAPVVVQEVMKQFKQGWLDVGGWALRKTRRRWRQRRKMRIICCRTFLQCPCYEGPDG